jgi:hypothetical protein
MEAQLAGANLDEADLTGANRIAGFVFGFSAALRDTDQG